MKQRILFVLFCLTSAGVLGQPAKKIMKWYNEPRKCRLDSGKVKVTADPHPDFWRKTFYKYVTDNGHFYYTEQKGDFEDAGKIKGNCKDQFDQVGVMIRTR